MSEKVILTEEGYKQLEKRLEELKFVKRPEITERIKVARDFGDLSENAEYDAAKNEQARIEGEIVEIEAKLKIAEIIKTDGGHGVVNVGSKVKILDGKALIGAKLGDTVTVKAPKCSYQVKILGIDG